MVNIGIYAARTFDQSFFAARLLGKKAEVPDLGALFNKCALASIGDLLGSQSTLSCIRNINCQADFCFLQLVLEAKFDGQFFR